MEKSLYSGCCAGPNPGEVGRTGRFGAGAIPWTRNWFPERRHALLLPVEEEEEEEAVAGRLVRPRVPDARISFRWVRRPSAFLATRAVSASRNSRCATSAPSASRNKFFMRSCSARWRRSWLRRSSLVSSTIESGTRDGIMIGKIDRGKGGVSRIILFFPLNI